MKKRRLLAILMCVSMMLAVASGCGAGGETTTSDAIKIGFYGPLTGPTSLAGQASKNGADLAVEEINAQGGINGVPVELIAYDDKSSPEQAVKDVTKLIDSDHVQGIVASLHSGNILAAAPVIEEAKVPTVGLGTSPEWLQKGYTYLFRSLANNEYGNIGICDLIEKMGYQKVGILYRAEDYSKFNADDITAKLQERGISGY